MGIRDLADPNSSNQEEVEQLWVNMNPATLASLVTMDENMKKAFIDGYSKDLQFWTIYQEIEASLDSHSQGNKFLQGEDGLLYFLNADYQPWLCVPWMLRREILEVAHEALLEMAHL